MDNFLIALGIEIDRERKLLDYHMNQLVNAPKGSLTVESSCDGPIYYWCFSEGAGANRETKQVNITDNLDLISQLVCKDLSFQIVEIAAINIPLMQSVAVEYLDIYNPLS